MQLLFNFAASLLLVGRASGSAANPNISKGWIQGRATFYGGADYFVDAYSVRGEGSFGDTLYGSCGLYEQQGNLSVRPQDVPYGDQVAAVGVLNADFPGMRSRAATLHHKHTPSRKLRPLLRSTLSRRCGAWL